MNKSDKQLEVRFGGNKTHHIMGKISPGKERGNRAISKEEAKAEAVRIIEEKLKNVEEKRLEEESKEGNNGFVGKKKSHFFSDLKVSISASYLAAAATRYLKFRFMLP